MKLEKICNWIEVDDISLPDTLPHVSLTNKEQLKEVVKQLDLHNVFYYGLTTTEEYISEFSTRRYRRYIIIAPLAVFEYIEEIKKEKEEEER